MTEELYTKSKSLDLDYIKDREEIEITFTELPTYSLYGTKLSVENKHEFINLCENFYTDIKKYIKDFINYYSGPAKDLEELEKYEFFYIGEAPDRDCEYPLYAYFMRYETEDEFILRKKKEYLAKLDAQLKREEKKKKKENKNKPNNELLKDIIKGLSGKELEDVVKELKLQHPQIEL